MAKMEELTGYDLSRNWFDWGYENPNTINPNHTALYFFIIEHCNRLGWKERFGLPTQMTMDAIGIKNWRTYKKTFDDLVTWGFLKVLEQSKNQYSATVIALVKNTKANTKALTKATQKHIQKQYKSIVDINKPINQGTIEPNNILSSQATTQEKKCEFWKKFVEKWENWYLIQIGSKYTYQAKDFASLKKIHKFFKKRAAEKKVEFTEAWLLDAFNWFLERAWNKDQWLKDNFSIPNLLSQFNQISNGTHRQAFTANQKGHGGSSGESLGKKSGGFGLLTEALKGSGRV